jgi:hypothetical protein
MEDKVAYILLASVAVLPYNTSSSGADGIFELRFERENFQIGGSRSRRHGDDAKLSVSVNGQIWVTSTCYIQLIQGHIYKLSFISHSRKYCKLNPSLLISPQPDNYPRRKRESRWTKTVLVFRRRSLFSAV